MDKSSSILIAGAGIGGLVAALSLIKRGFRVTICEQAPELKELGAGVQLSANGTRLLIDLGLGPVMEQVVCAASGKEVRLFNTGQTWKLFDLGQESVARFGAPYWLVHRGDFHRILVDAVEARQPGAIITSAAVRGCTQDASGVHVTLADGREFSGDLLIGADGVHSVIRQQLFGELKASFLGIAAWRGLVPMEKLPPHLARPVGTNWLGSGGHIVTYPVRHGTLLNFVGAIERDNWPVESWTERGTTEECLADFQGWHEDVQTIVRNIDPPYKWALLGRDPLMEYAIGSIGLIGDAAHPTLPFLAQGANMAIEDGAVIARLIEDAATAEEAWDRFEAARVERCAAIVRGASANALRFHNPTLADPQEAAAYVDREWQPEKISQRYDWLFEYNALTVPA